MAETNEKKIELKLFGHLLTPSFASATCCAVIALLFLGRALYSQVYSDSGPGADILRTIAASNQNLFATHQLPTNSYIADALVFAIWAILGAVVYTLAFELVRIIIEVHALRAQLGYIHSNRQAVIRTAIERVVTRLCGLALLFGSFVLLIKLALPYVAGTTGAFTAAHALRAVLGALLLAFVLHLIVVSARIIALRPRLFSAEIYR